MALPNEIHPFHLAGAGQGYQVANSLRFRYTNSNYLTRTPASSGNRNTWTLSFWMKRGYIGYTSDNLNIIDGQSSAGNSKECVIGFQSGVLDSISVYQWNGGGFDYQINTTQVLRDPAAWYHVVVAFDTTQATNSNRIKIYINGSQVTSFSTSTWPSQNLNTEFNTSGPNYIGRSVYGGNQRNFDGYLTEMNFVDGQQLTPSSFGETDSITGIWGPKKYTGTYGTNGFYLPFNNPSLSTNLATAAGTTATAPFGGTAANALTSDSVYLTSNTSTGSSFDFIKYDFGAPTQLTRYWAGALYFTGGTSTFQIQYSNDDVTYTSAASLSVTGSGQNFTGNLNITARYIKIYAASFGTNGQANIDIFAVYQDGLGLDSSGNGNNWTPTNISVTSGSTYDVMIDSPTNYNDGGNNRGSYCVLNQLNRQSNLTLTGANLDYSTPAVGYWRSVVATMGMTSGKWYWEATAGPNGAANHYFVGIVKDSYSALTDDVWIGKTSDGWGYYGNNGTLYNNNVNPAYGSSYTTNDVVGAAYDADNGKVYFSVNNVWQNSGNPVTSTNPAVTGLSGVILPAFSGYNGSGMYVNFGQRPFTYTPPAGFLSLNSYNLPNPSLPLV